MEKQKVTVTVALSYSREDIENIIKKSLDLPADANVSFKIEEVGADPMDRYGGHNEVTSCTITWKKEEEYEKYAAGAIQYR